MSDHPLHMVIKNAVFHKCLNGVNILDQTNDIQLFINLLPTFSKQFEMVSRSLASAYPFDDWEELV